MNVCGLTFEFTRPAEVGVVSPACDHATAGTRRAYNACRSGSGVQRVVRHHATVWMQISLLAPTTFPTHRGRLAGKAVTYDSLVPKT